VSERRRRHELVDPLFRTFQEEIVAMLVRHEGTSERFCDDRWTYPSGGGGRGRILDEGRILERAAVNFSHVQGESLPPAATRRRPRLAGSPFRALGVSVIVHPRNPYAPTSHCNVRYLEVTPQDGPEVFWFGGGFDLTPYYGFEEDCRLWHEAAFDACAPYGDAALYRRYKAWCDRYFYLPHRREPRGIGGLFFDDCMLGTFERTLGFVAAVARAYTRAYDTILARRLPVPWGPRERSFQLYRRGRYVEFNLLYDRGTRFGLESGGRTESILASLPPLARWVYDASPDEGAEADLREHYLCARDWLGLGVGDPGAEPEEDSPVP
jgi:coproporphyrinogen III oxidase